MEAPVAFTAQMDLDRRKQLAEAFREAWRVLRAQFYDPTMHGADWGAVRAKYEPLLGDVLVPEDFTWLLEAMLATALTLVACAV